MPSSLADQPSSRQPAHRATDRPTDCLYLTRTLQLLLLLLLSLNYLRTADTSHHITSPANKVIQFISCCRVPRQSIVMRHHPFLITAAVALMALVYSTADAETEFICEFTSKTLICSAGKSIDIKFANYGRIGHNVCLFSHYLRGYGGGGASGAGRINNCYDESHTELVGRLCNGKPSCILPAANDIFGDTCPGVLKYLQVKYRCV